MTSNHKIDGQYYDTPWLEIKLDHNTILTSFSIYYSEYNLTEPDNFYILTRMDDDDDYTSADIIGTFTNNGSTTNHQYRTYEIDPANYKVGKYYRIVITKNIQNYHTGSNYKINEWKLFGLKENEWPRQSRLHLTGIAGDDFTVTINDINLNTQVFNSGDFSFDLASPLSIFTLVIGTCHFFTPKNHYKAEYAFDQDPDNVTLTGYPNLGI